MKAVIQRVDEASVTVDGYEVSRIGRGVLTLLGIQKGDDAAKAKKLIKKICDLRIFEDSAGKMNLSLKDIGASHLIVSQFTLVADCSSGRRPSFIEAEAPEVARQLYEVALDESRNLNIPTASGVFQADMKISLLNSGPVTFVLEA